MSDNQTVNEQEVEVVRQEVAPVVAEARRLTVTSAIQYQDASEFLKQVKGAQRRVKDLFSPMKQAAHAAWKAVTSKEKETLAPLEDAEQTVKSRMLAWYQEQARKQEEEERRLRAAAEERARQERERLQKEAAKLKTPELREQRLEQAEQVVPAAVHVEPEAPKVAGQSIRKRWVAEIADPYAATQAVLAWPDWQAYITLSQSELDRFAARTKGQAAVPGITFREVSQLTSTGK